MIGPSGNVGSRLFCFSSSLIFATRMIRIERLNFTSRNFSVLPQTNPAFYDMKCGKQPKHQQGSSGKDLRSLACFQLGDRIVKESCPA